MQISISRVARAVGFASATILVLSSAAAAQPSTVTLPENAKGQAAINALGAHLPDVAKAHGLTAERLESILKSDDSLNVDTSGALFYVEAPLDSLVPEESTLPEGAGFAGYSPADAFTLHSKPGALRTIYLDFDGHEIRDTAWNATAGVNPYTAPAFDLDGSPSTFSDTERNRIIGIWRRVAEDFAAFDVNVTTEFPGDAALARSSTSDNVFGTRALITRRFNVCSGCGGVAYLGVFDYTSEYYKPALVFFDALGNGNEKYTAEAISHEVGHNLGLNHDGTSSAAYYQGHGSGETGWAPIMGNGYYKNLTQWSSGEYPDANNKENDYSVMQSNGLNIDADDHGNSPSSATLLPQGTSFTGYGVIQDRNDVDFFEFYSGIGDVAIEVERFTHGPNLDIEISVYSANQQLLAVANPSSLLSSSLAFSATYDGSYFVKIDGVGKGDVSTGYSDYGTLGQYRLTGTISSGSGNQAPVADARANVTSGTELLTVQFDGSFSYDSDGQIASYFWDFGDGATSTSASPQHSFTAGNYNVILTVTDDGGFSSSDQISIVAQEAPNEPPTAVASVDSTTGTAPATFQFSSQGSTDGDGSITSYHWSFGNGASSSAANPSYTYQTPGSYSVVLTVTDNDGASHSDTLSIVVEADPTFVAAPSGLSASASNTTVQLAWSLNSTNETALLVERGVESGKGRNKTVSWSQVLVLPATTVSTQETNVPDGTWLYRVRARTVYNGTTYYSEYSNEVKLSVGSTGGKGGGKGKR